MLQTWLHLPPKTGRHVFITDRLSNPERPGPKNQAAADCMGNSIQAWLTFYFPYLRNLEAS